MIDFTYVQVSIWEKWKLLGRIGFEAGQGNNEYYIDRADMLSKAYLFKTKHLILHFEVTIIKSRLPLLLEVFVPTND